MDIGEELETYTIEPLEEPVRRKENRNRSNSQPRWSRPLHTCSDYSCWGT